MFFSVQMASTSSCFLLIFVFIKFAAIGVFATTIKNYEYYTNSVETLHNEKDYSEFCEFNSKCICNEMVDGYFLHCEKELNAELKFYTDLAHASINVTCNNTIQTRELRYDYYSMMKLWRFRELRLSLLECPPQSYASLFGPFTQNSLITEEENKSNIQGIKIYCGDRHDFPIAKENFEGLSELLELEISCGALANLPKDLFQEKLPNLLNLKISDTKIDRIPGGIFSDLSKLESLVLYKNRLLGLNKQDFFGLSSLKVLELTENLLSSLEEDVFDFITALEVLKIFDSKITVLPKSFGRLQGYRVLGIYGNLLESIDANDCVGLSNVEEFYIENNRIKRLHPECFTGLKKVRFIRLLGTSLSSLPDVAILMEHLETFAFNHNSETVLRVGPFIVSDSLLKIEMINSSIESIDPEFLHSVPNLTSINLSENKLSTLREDFFAFCPKLEYINMRLNRLSTVPDSILSQNSLLKWLYISSNNISSLSPSLFANNSRLQSLDLSENNLEVLSKHFLSNLRNLRDLNLSKNELCSIENDSFNDMASLIRILLDHNMLNNIPHDIFSPFKNFEFLRHLNLESNYITSLPCLNIPTLEELNLANNMLKELANDSFIKLTNIKVLNLSRNRLTALPNGPLVKIPQKLLDLDLSFNALDQLPKRTLEHARFLKKLDLSGNKMKTFDLDRLRDCKILHELDLSSNGLYKIINSNIDTYSGGNSWIYRDGTQAIKVLNLSNNNISFNYCHWMFDKDRRTWGRVSPLVYLMELEELHLGNNSISEIFMDWRNMLRLLRILDLRHNKIKHLTHQDLLFSSTLVQLEDKVVPYKCTHSLQVDLRHNQIQGVDLPSSMLTRNTGRGCGSRIHSHATILLDDNPFSCDCELLNFLRLLNGDVILTSEQWRTEGKDWILPARINVGDLSCREPEAVRGNKLAETEMWTHHLLPLFGYCYMIGRQ